MSSLSNKELIKRLKKLVKAWDKEASILGYLDKDSVCADIETLVEELKDGK